MRTASSFNYCGIPNQEQSDVGHITTPSGSVWFAAAANLIPSPD